MKRIKTNGREYYKPYVEYEYEMDGRRFSSNNFSLFGGRSYKDESSALEIITRVKQKAVFQVQVCPIRKDYSYIERDVRFVTGMFGISAFSAISVMLMVMPPRIGGGRQ